MLVETSAWIQYYRDSGDVQVDKAVNQLLANNQTIETAPVIIQEVLQGFADPASYQKALNAFRLYPLFQLQDQQKAAIDAAEIYRTCRKNGYTIRKPTDCMIALIALTHQLTILHHDKDFNYIAKFYPLKVMHFLS